MVDDGPAIHYSAVPRGTPVYDADGNEIGTVDRVLDNYREHILDGFVIRMPQHGLRFVDAPEVGRTAERGVTLTITSAEAEALPPPPEAGPCLRPNLGSGTLGRLFGGRKRPRPRYGGSPQRIHSPLDPRSSRPRSVRPRRARVTVGRRSPDQIGQRLVRQPEREHGAAPWPFGPIAP